RGETALDTGEHRRHERVAAKALPAVLRVVDGDDHPAAGRRAGRVEELSLGEAAVAGMDGRDRRLVLLLRPAREVMHDAEGHLWLLSDRVNPAPRISHERSKRRRGPSPGPVFGSDR